MKAHFLGVAALALLLTARPLFAQKIDINQPQSPPKPTPTWVKMIDQGKNDPRLKGYFSPQGLKVEIVADAPQVINPVGMTFDIDGNLYVLEWVEVPANMPGANNPKAYIDFTYKDGTKRKVLIARKPIKDRVKMLGYNAKKGIYDSAKIVLEDDLRRGRPRCDAAK